MTFRLGNDYASIVAALGSGSIGLARRLACDVAWSARLNGHGRGASAKLGDLAVITRQPDPGGGSVVRVPGAGGTTGTIS